ncbi:hypothetical protein SAMN06296036_13451 [Pseudobacteriovorax antillogorgiicola]|uniref:Uncharacterized protein n=2 Tax=Pseudobacteriovorax antillogorgiicola TaxID=1513793 RepID=A0A1Y6CUC9_9BACT|nr:hypothetical protein EDD56_1352 [Pseudobacteriovorax antillogorgiicola]SMF80088.1 hypothetical protein SAMN06296036_13451 [Pseudobacteriovorax antillogorgiicola]
MVGGAFLSCVYGESDSPADTMRVQCLAANDETEILDLDAKFVANQGGVSQELSFYVDRDQGLPYQLELSSRNFDKGKPILVAMKLEKDLVLEYVLPAYMPNYEADLSAVGADADSSLELASTAMLNTNAAFGDGGNFNAAANANCSQAQLQILSTAVGTTSIATVKATRPTFINQIKLVNICGLSASSAGPLNRVEIRIDGELVRTVTIPPSATEFMAMEAIELDQQELEIQVVAGMPSGNSIDNFLIGAIQVTSNYDLEVVSP